MKYNYKKIGVTLLIMAALLVVFSIGTYSYVFYNNPLSSDMNDWGAFGSYVGGVIGASITPLALAGAVLAIFQQHNASVEDKNQSTAAAILRTIERIEDSIDSELKEHTYNIEYVDMGYSINSNAYNILTNLFMLNTEKVIPYFGENGEDFKKKMKDKNVGYKEKQDLTDAYSLFSSTGGKFSFIKTLIEKHTELSKNNVAAIYYKKKYKHAVNRLIERGYPIKSWEDIDQMQSS